MGREEVKILVKELVKDGYKFSKYLVEILGFYSKKQKIKTFEQKKIFLKFGLYRKIGA